MITTRKAVSQDIDEFKKVVVESVLELCKDCYTPTQLKSLLGQYPARELYEKWIHERVLARISHQDRGSRRRIRVRRRRSGAKVIAIAMTIVKSKHTDAKTSLNRDRH